MKTQGLGHRAKRIRTTEPCGMKLNMYKLWDEKNQLVSVELSRNELKSRGKEEVCYTHNHTLEYHMLETREALDDIMTRFFELDELTFGFTPAQKDKYLMLWVQNLKKMTGQIRKTAAKDALKQLQDEGLVLTGEAADEVQLQAWD